MSASLSRWVALFGLVAAPAVGAPDAPVAAPAVGAPDAPATPVAPAPAPVAPAPAAAPYAPATPYAPAAPFTPAAPPAPYVPAAPAAPAAAPESPGRSGFFLRFAPKFSYLFLSSNANVASGFRQELSSSAYAPGYGFEGQIGREVWGRVSLAAALDFETYRSVHVKVAGETIAMEHFQLGVVAFGLVVTAFPFEDLGWHTALKLSACSVEPALDNESFNGTTFPGPQMRGVCVSGLGGYEWRVSRGWWMGLGARFSYLRNTTKEGDQSLNAVSPGLMLTATYY